MLEKYLNQDIDNPDYLFHGSPLKLFELEPNLSYDTNQNIDNISNAIFLFPSFLKATPYAFKDTIKSNSEGLKWNFEIPNTNDYPLMIMKNVNIEDNIKGYIYVFQKDNSMIKDENTYQYKCYHTLKPIDVIEIKYNDYKEYYKVINENILKR